MFKSAMRAIVVVGFGLGLVTTDLAGSGTAAFAPALAPGRVLVRFVADAPAAQVAHVLDVQGLTIQETIMPLGIAMVPVPPGREEAIARALGSHPLVAYAEPDRRVCATLTPDDPSWSQQWGPAKINAPAAWDIVTGTTDVVIAIVDSGVKLDHEDLGCQLWTNPGEIPGNYVDDDNNGKVDDVHGWHLYTIVVNWQLVSLEDANVADDYGHGSHVAGIAAARGNNGVGIAGMAWGARVMVVKVLDKYGDGWYSDIIKGIVYATDNGACVLNLSLGGSEPSQALQDAVTYAYTAGCLVIAATGNDGGTVLYPAACDHVLAVAATNADDQHPSFSNHGPEVDVAAPGVNIFSTWPWRDGYWTKSGTSMATPHVSGLAALIWSLRPDYTNAQVQQRIEQTALDLGDPGWDEFTGWGRIDAYQAIIASSRCEAYLPFVLKGYRRSWWPTSRVP